MSFQVLLSSADAVLRCCYRPILSCIVVIGRCCPVLLSADIVLSCYRRPKLSYIVIPGRCRPASSLWPPLSTADTNLAPRYSRSQTAGFEGLGSWVRELVSFFDGGEPERVLVGEVVTRAAGAVALDERRRAEVLQARPGRRQRLTSALRSGRRVHSETVTNPERGPASWTVGDRHALTVHGDDVGWNFTDNAS